MHTRRSSQESSAARHARLSTEVKLEPLKDFNAEEERKYAEIRNFFEDTYETSPDFFARVPGRVNIIGEHIDYCGYFVLPMAIEQDIIMAVKSNSTSIINLVNFDESYDEVSMAVEDFSIDCNYPKWYHYFICGYQGIAANYHMFHKGMDVVVKGTIPPSSGLSSSSALVCASALAASHANRILLSKMDLAALCADSETYVGTEGGGMDQAIAFLAEPGAAKLIEFKPLKATTVPLPDSVAFVVTNSGVMSNKAATNHFNTRVMECKLAAKLIAKMHGLNWKEVEKLSEIPILLGKDLTEMEAVFDEHFPHKSFNKYELCNLLEVTDAELTSILSQNTKHLEFFQLQNRAVHVFQEANRVKEFKRICESKVCDVRKLGQLMNESHASLKDLYNCSHPVLDELVETARSAGALGSRLTGAGWGGCCVSMVWKDKVEEFMSIMKEKFYEKRPDQKDIDIKTAMFATKPSGGAAVYM